jgi:MFS family permease
MKKKNQYMYITLKIISLIFVNFAAVFYYFTKCVMSNVKDFLINGDNIIGPITATVFSEISSAFSISYSIFQPVGGYLLDKYSFSKVYTLFFVLGVLFNFFFTKGTTIFSLLILRYIMGFFFCISSTGSMKYISLIWHKNFILMMSISKLLMNGSGAFASSNYIYNIMEKYGWRNTILFTNIIGVLISLILFFSLKYLFIYNNKKEKDLSKEVEKTYVTKITLVDSLKNIFNTNGFISISIFSVFTSASAYLLMDGWGNTLFNLQYSNNLSYISPATLSLLGACLGNFLNIWSEKIPLKIQMFIYSFLGFLSLVLIIYGPKLPYIFLFSCFLIGINYAVQNLSFRWIQENIKDEFLGFAFSIFNFICMFFGCALIQKFAGFILDLVKEKSINSGINFYKGYIYNDLISLFKFLMIPVLLSFIFIFFMKNNSADNNCKKNNI